METNTSNGYYNNDWGKKATMKYISEKQKTIHLRYKKTDFEERILPEIHKSGLPVATFIKQAVEEKIERSKGR